MISSDLAMIRSFEVVPALPARLQPLLEIAHNLWWTWHPEAVDLFVRLDSNLWEATNHNPVKLLGSCSQARLDAAASDEGFLASLDHAVTNLKRHLARTPWLEKSGKETSAFTIAYFLRRVRPDRIGPNLFRRPRLPRG